MASRGRERRLLDSRGILDEQNLKLAWYAIGHTSPNHLNIRRKILRDGIKKGEGARDEHGWGGGGGPRTPLKTADFTTPFQKGLRSREF